MEQDKQTIDPVGRQFLERQAEIVRQRQEARTESDDLKAGWDPSVMKDGDNMPKPAVFDANEVPRHLPTPEQRIKKAPLLPIEELREKAIAAGDEIQGAVEQFKHDDNNRDAYYAELKSAGELIDKLEHELSAAKAKADELKARAHLKRSFCVRSVVESYL